MRVFVDTNILIELFENRKEADNVDLIFEYIEQNNWDRYLSVGSFYTLTYLLERILRHQGLANPERLHKLREILHRLLQTFHIAGTRKDDFLRGISNETFKDLEDSYQYETALHADCDVLLTINVRDFSVPSQSGMSVFSPEEFIKCFIL